MSGLTIPPSLPISGVGGSLSMNTNGVLSIASATGGFVATVTVGPSGLTTFGGTVSSSGVFQSTQGGGIVRYGGSGNGIGLLQNATANDFNRLQFGGTTLNFPSIQRSGAGLIARLADDSADTTIRASTVTIADGIAAPSAAVGFATIFVDAADGDLKIIFGDGTVKTIVTDS